MLSPVTVIRGDGPVLLSFPHTGLQFPHAVAAKLTPFGQSLIDTDWHVDRLYDGLLPNATVVKANFHRYVIDVNRPPDDAPLYENSNTPGLIPLATFDGAPLWTNEISRDEIRERIEQYYSPYHARLRQELERIRSQHGVAILYDCHSIRSKISRLFNGTLPDFSIGTNAGRSCHPSLETAIARLIGHTGEGYSCVANGRFQGGWITRHYGRPDEQIHAIQMELSQSTYLKSEIAPFDYDTRKAMRLRQHLGSVLQRLESLAYQLKAAL